jgi:hypothetical protein
MAPLLLGAIYLTIIGEKKNKIWIYFLNGLLIGLAAFYKLTSVLFLSLIVLFIVSEDFASRRPFRGKRVLIKTFLLVAGFILVQIPFLYYFWIHHALKDVYEALFTHLSLYVRLARGRRIETFFSGHYSVLSENLILWLFAAISSLYIFFKDRSRDNVLVALWGICSLLMVWGQGKFFGYHFLLIVPPFSVLTGYGLTRVFEPGRGFKGFLANNLADIRKTFMLTTIGFCVLGFAISNYDYYKRHVDYLLGKITKIEYYDVFNEFPTHLYSFRSDYQIVEYLRGIQGQRDQLAVVYSGGDTVIHFLTGLEPVSRFIQSWYLFPEDELLAKSPITVRLRRELIDQITSVGPRFILLVYLPLEELVNIPTLKDDPSVKRLFAFIQANYALKEFPDNRFLYTRITPPPGRFLAPGQSS